MRMYDLIEKKKKGEVLREDEIEYMISGYVEERIPDYQMSAMLMAIYFQGLTEEETAILTKVMTASGDIVDLSKIKGIKVDKHSTGGVGDKTSLIIGPMVAACGGKVAKMSGRGLGHTGGTIDKMESIPGMKTSLSMEEFTFIVNNIGVSVIGQTGNLAPADKKLYALRDVTTTVDSLPLIASSIMSKKLASGSDCILLDVKTGSGAFMKTMEESIELAKRMVSIGESAGKKTVALITDMDIPLGYAIGNSLEIIEVINTLHNKGPKDLTEISIQLSANMLNLSGLGTLEECKEKAIASLEDGSAFAKFLDMVKAQGGDVSVIKDTNLFPKAPFTKEVLADQEGYITAMDTEKCGITSLILGAGREKKDSEIDYTAGIVLKKKLGDYVKKKEPIASLYTSDQSALKEGADTLINAIKISKEAVELDPLIYARVEYGKVERYL